MGGKFILAKFDYAAWKAEWKRRAAHYGIDPETGATGYQVCIVKAEMAKTAARQRGKPWWADDRLWVDGAAHSETELEALRNVREAARAYRPRRVDYRPADVIIREVWREAKAEMAI